MKNFATTATHEYRVVEVGSESWINKLNALGAEGFGFAAVLPAGPSVTKSESYILLTRVR
jgi:hypothetical protein